MMEFEKLMEDLNKIRIKMEEFAWCKPPKNLQNKYYTVLNSITDLLQANGNIIKIIQPSDNES